jgi:hypothetical protein
MTDTDAALWRLTIGLPPAFLPLDVSATARARGTLGIAVADDVVDGQLVHADFSTHCIEGPDAIDRPALDDLTRWLATRDGSDVGQLETSIVDINGRPAVRRAGFSVLDVDAISSPIVATLDYWIPVPDTGTLAVLSFRTPHVEATDEMRELFDVIAGTVTIT